MAQSSEVKDQIFDAAENLRIDVVEKALKQGVNVNVTNNNNETLLHVAAKRGDGVLVRILIEMSADLNRQDIDGNTALNIACWNRRKFVIKKLLENGANVNVRNNENVSPLYNACWRGDHKSVDALLEKGAEVEVNCLGKTPLLVACSFGWGEVISTLLRHGAKVNNSDCEGMTPLHYASVCNVTELVTTLLEKSARVNVRNHKGETPLHFAASGQVAIVHKLLDNGATIDIKSNCGETPYDVCLRNLSDMGLTFEMRTETKSALVEHVIKLKTAGLAVSIDVTEELGSKVNKKRQSKCLKEMEKIKATKIFNVPLYVVFSKIGTPYYLNDRELLYSFYKFLNSPNLSSGFPLFGHILRNTFDRYYLSMLADDILSKIETCPNLPDLARQHIIRYLSVEDLRSLVKSGTEDTSNGFPVFRTTTTMFSYVRKKLSEFVTIF